MLIEVDRRPVHTQSISHSGWKSYPVTLKLRAGSHRFAISNKDRQRKSGCKSKLRVDYVDFRGGLRRAVKRQKPQPAPAPTPAPSPEPTPEPTPAVAGARPVVCSSGARAVESRLRGPVFDGALLNSIRLAYVFLVVDDHMHDRVQQRARALQPGRCLPSQAGPCECAPSGGNMVAWNGNTYHYTSRNGHDRRSEVRIATSGFVFTYGYAEARVRVPKGKGVVARLLAASSELQTPGPRSTSSRPRGSNTNRGELQRPLCGPSTPAARSRSGFLTSRPATTPSLPGLGVRRRSSFYVDGVERWRYTGPGEPPPSRKYLVLNLAVGGSYDGAPDASTPFPSYFDVDHVRVWQRP